MSMARFHAELLRRIARNPPESEQCGRCRDCRWWDTEDHLTGLCSAIGDLYMVEDYERRAWWPQDTFGMHFLATRADFGCYEFKPKGTEGDDGE